jgi:hypothetical protein
MGAGQLSAGGDSNAHFLYVNQQPLPIRSHLDHLPGGVLSLFAGFKFLIGIDDSLDEPVPDNIQF